jgi:hypothetical protein
MNRSLAVLISGIFATLLLAGLVAAQQFDEIPSAAPAAPQPPVGASAVQPAQPAAALPPPAQVRFNGAPAGQATSGGSFVLQGGGRGRAVIARPGAMPGGGGFGRAGFGPAVSFGMGPGPDDPDMAKLIESEHELDRQSHDLIRKYAETEDQQVREKAKTALREMLNNQFDLQNDRRELELKRVEERLAKLRDQLKKRSDARTQIVGQRLEQLVNEAEGLGWTSPTGGNSGLNLQFTPHDLPGPRPSPAIAR